MARLAMRRVPGMLLLAAALLCGGGAQAFDHAGHQFIGDLADRLLNPRAQAQVNMILEPGWSLKVAATWPDCAKGVGSTGGGTFAYRGDPQFAYACAPFETDAGRARMEDFVRRNWTQCSPRAGQEVCHKQYHYTDVPIQRERYDRAFPGTSDHDIVGAIDACVAVLRGQPAPPPFSIRDRQEALLLLAHFVGDVHQPLHVGALYLDPRGQPADPGASAAARDTRGGNNLLDQAGPPGRNGPAVLHLEWDQLPPALRPPADAPALLDEARALPRTAGTVDAWAANWASETVLVARQAFDGLRYAANDKRPGLWDIVFGSRAEYMAAKEAVQARQLLRAGARLAQLLNDIWP